MVEGYHGLFCHVHLLPRRRLRRLRPLRRRGTSRRRAGVLCFPCDMDTKPEAILCSPSSRLLPRVNLSPTVFIAPCVLELERLRQAPQCEQTHLPTSSSPLIVPCFVHLYRVQALPHRTSSPASVPTSPRCPCASNRDESFCRTDSLFQLAVLILGSSGPTSSAAPCAQRRRLPCLALLRPQPVLVWQIARRLASLCFAAWQQVSARVHAHCHCLAVPCCHGRYELLPDLVLEPLLMPFPGPSCSSPQARVHYL